MSILRRLVERRDLHASNFDPSRIPLNSESGGYSATGIAVSPDSAMRLAAVSRAVQVISRTIAALPVGVYRKQGTARLELDPPRWMRRPNPDFNLFEFLEQIMCSLLLYGNAYVVKVMEGGQIFELWVMHPDTVRVVKRGAGRVYEVYRGGQLVGAYTPDEVVHIRGFSMPGSLYGLSPIEYARQSIGLALAAEEYGGRFFGNGAAPGGVIEVPAEVGDDQLKLMAAKWKAKHQGLANAHEPGFLIGGSKWQSITIPNDSAQFIETRKMQISEIARLFGVPAHKIGDMEHATYSNIEHQAIEFVQDCILPWLKCLEEAFNPLLGRGAAPDLRTGAYVKWNVDGLLRGDSKSRAEFYTVMRNIGAYNGDDIRALEDQPPIPNGAGQMYWRPLNMADAASPVEPPAPPAAPASPPAKPATNGNADPDAARVARLLAAGRQ